MTGRVKSYNPKTGWGFIESDGNDYLFSTRYSEGEKVEFDPQKTSKGLRATNIRKTGNETLR